MMRIVRTETGMHLALTDQYFVYQLSLPTTAKKEFPLFFNKSYSHNCGLLDHKSF